MKTGEAATLKSHVGWDPQNSRIFYQYPYLLSINCMVISPGVKLYKSNASTEYLPEDRNVQVPGWNCWRILGILLEKLSEAEAQKRHRSAETNSKDCTISDATHRRRRFQREASRLMVLREQPNSPWPFSIPSGKRWHKYGKTQAFMGKLSISMDMFNSYVWLPEGSLHKKYTSITSMAG